MKRILMLSAIAGMIAVVGLGPAAAQEEGEAPSIIPVELYLCSYNEGKGPADLEPVVDKWNAWADEAGLTDYTGLTMVPFYYGPDQEFDFGWMGVSPNAKALGRAQDTWLATGGESQAEWDELSTCSVHANFAAMQIKAPPEGPVPDSIIASFSNCKIAEGNSFSDLAPALNEWAEYRSEHGSTGGIWVFFPAYGGGGEEYDFKYVASHRDLEGQGADWDQYSEGGHEKATELFADLVDCDSSRVYAMTTRRRAEAPAE